MTAKTTLTDQSRHGIVRNKRLRKRFNSDVGIDKCLAEGGNMANRASRVVAVMVLLVLILSGTAFARGEQEARVPRVELQYIAWDLGTPAWSWFEDRFAEFEEMNPHVSIRTSGIPASDYRTVIMQQVLSGDAPDLVPIFSDQLLVLQPLGYLEPLDRFLENSELNDRLLPVVRHVAEIDGSVYAVLRALPPWMLHANMRILNEAGIQEPPSTLEEFYAAAKAVKENTDAWGYVGWLDSANVHDYTRTVLAWFVGFGGHFTSEPGKLAVNQQANVDALTWLRRFKNEGLMPMGIAEGESYDLFVEEKAAMMVVGTWLAGMVMDRNPSSYRELKVVSVPMPARGSLTGGGWLGIPAASRNKDLAWQLIEHMYSSENQVKWVQQSGRLGSTTDLPSDEWIAANAPFLHEMKMIGEQYVDALGYDPIGFEAHSAEFKREIMPYLVEAMETTRPVRAILDEAQAHLVRWAESKGIPQ
ncbi:MAG: sugar ABC transporter substrate-binding protein [Spirochaetaceae bacterium]|nr:MAG: sugar ABC transporter substrate-binding protein [Spirochaetaceae bacterium]